MGFMSTTTNREEVFRNVYSERVATGRKNFVFM
jgi:hypothetical protein